MQNSFTRRGGRIMLFKSALKSIQNEYHLFSVCQIWQVYSEVNVKVNVKIF